jgi:hypothetical protein
MVLSNEEMYMLEEVFSLHLEFILRNGKGSEAGK